MRIAKNSKEFIEMTNKFPQKAIIWGYIFIIITIISSILICYKIKLREIVSTEIQFANKLNIGNNVLTGKIKLPLEDIQKPFLHRQVIIKQDCGKYFVLGWINKIIPSQDDKVQLVLEILIDQHVSVSEISIEFPTKIDIIISEKTILSNIIESIF